MESEESVHPQFRNPFHNGGMNTSVLFCGPGAVWRRAWRVAGSLALLMGSVSGAPALAGGNGDHERALEAVRAGQVLPLRVVLERLERERPGQVMEVELERGDGGWVYEVKLLREGGELVRLKLDARTAAVLESKSKARGTREP